MVALQGLLHLSKPFLHISQGRIELRIGRFQLQRLLIIGLGLFILLQSLVSAAPLPVKPLVPRWQFDCPGEVKDSFVIQLHSGKAQAPIAVYLRSLLQLQRPAVVPYGLFRIPLVVADTQVPVEPAVLHSQLFGFREVLQRLGIVVGKIVELSPLPVGLPVLLVQLDATVQPLKLLPLFGVHGPEDGALGLAGGLRGPQLLLKCLDLLLIVPHPLLGRAFDMLAGVSIAEPLPHQVHHLVKALNGDKVSAVALHHLLNLLRRLVVAVAPVEAAQALGLLQKVHQAVVAPGIADHHGGITLEGLPQDILPLLRQAVDLLGPVEGVKEQAPVELGDDGPAGVEVDVLGQQLVADDDGPFIRVDKQGVLHQAVEIGGDHQVVARVGQQGGQGIVAQAGLGALQRPLQKSGAVLIVRKKAHGIEVKIGPAGRLGRAHPQPLFQLLDLLLGALLQNLPVPLFGQFLPGGDTRGLGGPGAQDEAVAPLVFTALLKGIQEHI